MASVCRLAGAFDEREEHFGYHIKLLRAEEAPMRKITTTLLALAVAACSSLSANQLSPYRIEIQQGNFVTQEMVAQLKPGLTKEQVRFILGTPLVADIFHADRWDYVFTRRRANSREVEERRITVLFEDGKLKRVEGDVVAGAPRPQSPPAPISASEQR